MKNIDVVNSFLNKQPAYGSHLISTGDKLISYNTTIAQYNNEELHINKTKYSCTTSRHLHYIYCFIIKEFGLDFPPLIEKDNLGIGIQNIINVDSKFIINEQKYRYRYGIQH